MFFSIVSGLLYQRLVRRDHLVLIAVMSTPVITSPSISNYGYFEITKVAYGQSEFKNYEFGNLQDIPSEKVHVGNIEIAYKMFGMGDPVFLYNCTSENMDVWDPSF